MDTEIAQKKIQNAINEAIDDLDKSYFRKMQVMMHYCAAHCLENETASLDDVNRCVEKCSHPLNKAQTYVQTELQHFQDRLQRCIQSCQDKIKDQVTQNTTPSQMQAYKSDFENCSVKCVEDHVNLLPKLISKMKDFMQPEFSSQIVSKKKS